GLEVVEIRHVVVRELALHLGPSGFDLWHGAEGGDTRRFQIGRDAQEFTFLVRVCQVSNAQIRLFTFGAWATWLAARVRYRNVVSSFARISAHYVSPSRLNALLLMVRS